MICVSLHYINVLVESLKADGNGACLQVGLRCDNFIILSYFLFPENEDLSASVFIGYGAAYFSLK